MDTTTPAFRPNLDDAMIATIIGYARSIGRYYSAHRDGASYPSALAVADATPCEALTRAERRSVAAAMREAL